MNILIIGGTNFIGPPVIRELAAGGHRITVFHRGQTQTTLPEGVDEILGDRHQFSTHRSEVQQIAPDVVLDMIPYTQADAQEVLETIRGICDRVVAISSQDVYRARDVLWGIEPDQPDPVPLTEDAPLRSHLYPYKDNPPLGLPSDYDKILVEQAYLNDAEIQSTVLRLPMVYGPGDPLHRFAAYLDRMQRGRSVIVLEKTLANWRSSYGYVENVAHGIALVVTHRFSDRSEGNDRERHPRIFNISEQSPLSEIERVTLLGQLAGWTGKAIAVDVEQLPESHHFPFNMRQDWVTDSSRIRQQLGYREHVDRKEAMKRTIEWERSHPLIDTNQSASAMVLLDESMEDKILASLS